ncbi:MAG: DUF1013 domain-containing protein [Alphaproteobacteria bacterium]|jgi:hypothetical protein|nr:DUF1013 domain-containing protein [Alphaproteobacteria bacterium]MCB1550380.1 DUF1013 domain-containing protein [Alphaproteobacteria bacterium]MCB9985279.1 DUF1013 domain-containing protein [Micavibrio sp.]HPQ50915.1 DUF1013 domain-containing protein [Alphaproteobacteria bacterium]HRK98222.1 DUF1013 domain-containing protein [Alphaproteobacteria bacterium]
MAAAAIEVSKPLKPKASAVWLIDNSTLSFEQIAEYTGLHVVEIQALADEEVGRGIIGESPVQCGELSAEEIARCEKDQSAILQIIKREGPALKSRAKGPRYTPVARRNDKPDAIAYLLKHHSEISDAQVCKLVGTTKPTIQAIRDRTHPNSSNINPRNPTEIGLCTYAELDKAVRKGLKAKGIDPDAKAAEDAAKREAANAAEEAANAEAKANDLSSFDFSNFLKTSSSN